MKLGTHAIAVVALVSGLLWSISHGGGDWASIVPTVHADHRHASETCSNATLNGSYGFYQTGIVPLSTGGTGPLARVGTLFFDGDGNGIGTQNTSRNGDFTFDVTLAFTYEVAEDCTGKEFTPTGVEFARLVIVDRGKEFYFLGEASGSTSYGVAKRIHRPEHDDDR